MNDPYRRPIGWLEHFLHLNLTMITSGIWGIVWYHRAKKGRAVSFDTPTCSRCNDTGIRGKVSGINWVVVTCDHSRWG
ncbi:hypothetical protein [Actinoplanes xinjiangensis]|uniref:Uncharacterized protein n=1 Tax=Actinoplanes xinjiangensis TaxID=512350 RepID=A0A316FC81_9ACTN|nr:hypothetical protein [Actinoplanes xinjiangensis]PWK43581.1 hypothetical protein BC793_113263 [Actinoplanes xinjiangensis]GIF41900.1 hypothetical protein Axi01nite_62110 [Actinoplanes xinjiangensis]